MLRAVTVVLSVASTTARVSAASSARRAPSALLTRRCSASTKSAIGQCKAQPILHAPSSTASDGEVTESTRYEVHSITGDGRCLFRSLAVSRSLSELGERLPEEEELVEADILRSAAVDELLERREETEWFIEGDFDEYCLRMRGPAQWGGEPEILMLTHVLASPISVFMLSNDGGLNNIGVYGEEYSPEAQYDDLVVLFHGAGHYEALRVLN